MGLWKGNWNSGHNWEMLINGIIEREVHDISLPNLQPSRLNAYQGNDVKYGQENTLRDKNVLNATTTIISIVLAFLLCHLPILLNALSFVLIKNHDLWNIQWFLQLSTYLCTIINSVANLYIYVWKLQECKMYFLQTYLSWNASCRQQAGRLRVVIYNIVVMEKSERHSDKF